MDGNPLVCMQGYCEVCKKNLYKYKCPKCNVIYCSLDCYKIHNEDCTEEFSKQNIIENLRNTKVTDCERKKFEKLLLKFHNFDVGDENEDECEEDEENYDDDDSDEYEEEKRIEYLKFLAENDDLDENILTEREKREFRSDLKSGILNQYLSEWYPWWLKFAMDDNENVDVQQHICCQENRKVNGGVAYTVIQLLYSYVHLMRRTNGDLFHDIMYSIQCLGVIAKGLLSANIPSIADIYSVLTSATLPPVQCTDRIFNIKCLLDVAKILSFRNFGIKCFKDLLKLMKITNDELVQNENPASQKLSESRLMHMTKKLIFLESFTYFHWDVLLNYRNMVVELHDCKINHMEAELEHGKKIGCNSKLFTILKESNDERKRRNLLSDNLGSIHIDNIYDSSITEVTNNKDKE